MNIKTDLTSVNYRSGRNGNSIKYIVCHFTGNQNDKASGNANYFRSVNRQASAHYFVDDNEIVQVVREGDTSWHCGDGNGRYGITNSNSIGIEMCATNGDISEKTIENTLWLVKSLMNKYGIDIDHVVRHYDASRKCCPSPFAHNNWSRWWEFKNRLKGEQGVNVEVNEPQPSQIVNDIKANAKVINDFLYARNSEGNKVGGYASEGDEIEVLDVSYSRQLALIKYPTSNGAKERYVTNATNCIEYFYQDEYQNGSTPEPVYQDSSCSQKIGTLNPWEKATPIYRKDGVLHVVYSTWKGRNTKSGFVKYNGRFDKF